MKTNKKKSIKTINIHSSIDPGLNNVGGHYLMKKIKKWLRWV